MRLFIAFRVFFNARFYYPVFTILFLDYGLTIAEFAILNAVWAATIVVMEIPSGALADAVGRRILLIAAGVLMVLEMAILCFTPKGYPTLLFVLFMVNRILSGTAEAAASGADEALAYDALKAEGDEADWGKVLEVQIRWQSIGFIVAMSLGAVVYDPELLQKIVTALGMNMSLTQDSTLRIPVFLTLIMAVLTCITAFRMQESTTGECAPDTAQACATSMKQAFRLTLGAGRWILQTPFALSVILTGLVFDGVTRMVITLSSQYYRMIHLPEALFGLIGSGVAGMGLFVPRLARHMAGRHTPVFNLAVLSVLTLMGLVGMMRFFPYAGLIPAVILFGGMYLKTFFVSHYLNRITPSHNRATVLSFRGLAFNVAYGLFGILYSLLLGWLRGRLPVAKDTAGALAVENRIFIDSFSWFPWVFVVLLVLAVCCAAVLLRHKENHKRVG